MTQTVTFAGQVCEVLKTSAHGNYLVLKLTDRVSVVGTYSNKFKWEESPDLDSGFQSFILYIGMTIADIQSNECDTIVGYLQQNGADFQEPDSDRPRQSKRVVDKQTYPLELKVRGLGVEVLPGILAFLQPLDF